MTDLTETNRNYADEVFEENTKNKLPIGQHSRESVRALFEQWFNGRARSTEVFKVRLNSTQNEIRFERYK